MSGIGYGCAPVADFDQQVQLTAVGYDQLSGWRDDRHGAALTAFRRSCRALLKKGPGVTVGTGGAGLSAAVWHRACRAAHDVKSDESDAPRRYFESWFRPYRVSREGGRQEGLFTGYYEPELRGSKTRSGPYQVPLYARPPDLLTIDLGQFYPDLAKELIVGRAKNGRLTPYPTRTAIDNGALGAGARPLVWVDSAVDAFFLHIQGSGRVRLTDGSMLRLGFAASNGRAYTAIGKILVDRGQIPRDRVSMQSIRVWLAAHPDAASKVMGQNARYIFFRPIPGAGPVGAQGVALTAGRSLAIDRTLLPMGAPLWVETRDPLDPTQPFRRLMIAQDTGSAIKGAVRGDIFFGHGRLASRRAGLMKQPGRYFILLPRSKTPTS